MRNLPPSGCGSRAPPKNADVFTAGVGSTTPDDGRRGWLVGEGDWREEGARHKTDVMRD